jgi:hypothetical protein
LLPKTGAIAQSKIVNGWLYIDGDGLNHGWTLMNTDGKRRTATKEHKGHKDGNPQTCRDGRAHGGLR